jgi:hypothetical protein
MFDVFYSGKKPGVFAHEKSAESFEHAQSLSRTRYFWWITYLADYSDFDFLWEPVPWQSEFTHAWPSQWHDHSGTYLVPRTGAVDRYHFHAQTIPNKEHSKSYKFLVKDAEFDTSWAPHPHDPPYNYVFGNQWWPGNVMPTVEYHVPGATQTKYIDTPQAQLPEKHANRWHKLVNCVWDRSWCPDPGDPPYIYVFGNQWWPAEKMPTVEYHVPGATERKYVNWPRAELLEDRTAWTVPANIDESTVDFSWQPDPGDPPYIYQFATQHQRTGGPVYTVPGAVEIKYVDQICARVDSNATAIYEIDHLCGSAGKIANTTKTVRYFDNYRDTLIRIAKSIGDQHEFIWICSSICDYTDFDFSWHPEQWQATMLHVFASNEQKFGDTFFMHVPTFAARAEKKALLEWYDVNYLNRPVARRSPPLMLHHSDSHVEAVQTMTWAGPLAVFNADTSNMPSVTLPAVNLWRKETKTIVPLTASASTVLVPKTAVPLIKTQLYDYPYIDKTHRQLHPAQLMDIVFISYDEPEADRNWDILHNKFPQSHRVHGVAGMELALEAAADVSTTPWYWAVFAKTELAPNFDFGFVPDYMQQAKHYIFNCRNMVNGLEYGHMGMVLYNCQGIRDINRKGNFGLDYTLSFPHESIPILSCLGRFNTTPYHTWRTAFRETAKLAFFESEQSTVDGQYRLRTWLDRAEGDHAEWCLRGAQDGQEFFETTNGELDKLKQSFRWEWLREYFNSRYSNLE